MTTEVSTKVFSSNLRFARSNWTPWTSPLSSIRTSPLKLSPNIPAYAQHLRSTWIQSEHSCSSSAWTFALKKKKKKGYRALRGLRAPPALTLFLILNFNFNSILTLFWHDLKFFHFGHWFWTRYEIIFQISNLIF